LRDELRDLALFRAVYSGDPQDETLVTFFGMLRIVPDAVKIAWGYGGDDSVEEMAERMEREAAQRQRFGEFG
jgi:hypothetical protein